MQNLSLKKINIIALLTKISKVQMYSTIQLIFFLIDLINSFYQLFYFFNIFDISRNFKSSDKVSFYLIFIFLAIFIRMTDKLTLYIVLYKSSIQKLVQVVYFICVVTFVDVEKSRQWVIFNMGDRLYTRVTNKLR